MATTAHCIYCFDTLHDYLYKDNRLEESKHTGEISDDDKLGIFVSWHRKGKLRGCLGSLEPIAIRSGLKSFAVKAATKDSRFKAITTTEFQDLEVGVSLLVNFERNLKWNDWQIGKHGILIRFQDGVGRSFSATYLPEVASSQGWNHMEAMHSLIEKSGFTKTVDDKLLNSIVLDRYQSSKCTLTFNEWQTVRE